MSLFGIYVIIAYYDKADRSQRYKHKITNQRFDTSYVKDKIENILSYQSDALHWNLAHIDRVGSIGQKALKSYAIISKKLRVKMHSLETAQKRVAELLKGKDDFMKLSRMLAEKAQKRERMTIQPKEDLSGAKAIITIKNYLGGFYFFTSDEAEIKSSSIYLIEGKHSTKNSLPSLEDIKDGLLKMILFTNLENVKLEGKEYRAVSILKLTVEGGFSQNNLTTSQKRIFETLKKEAKINNFRILVNE